MERSRRLTLSTPEQWDAVFSYLLFKFASSYFIIPVKHKTTLLLSMYRSIISFCKLIFGYVVLAKATHLVFGLLLGYKEINFPIIKFLMGSLSEQWTNMYLIYLSAIVNAFEGLSGIMVLVFAFLADEIMGEYLMIIVSTISYIIVLSLYYIYDRYFQSTLIFLLSVPFLITGKAGQYNLEEFLANNWSVSTDNNDKQKKEKTGRIGNFILFLFAFFGSFFLASAIWKKFYPIEILLLAVALILFSLTKTIYIFKEETESPMYTIYEVFKASLLKQNRPAFLNVESEKIEDVKRLKVFAPVLLSFLLYTLVEAAATTFFIEQVLNLDGSNHFLAVFVHFGEVISSLLKLCMILTELRNKIGVDTAGAGFICSFICSLVAFIVESIRLQLIPKYPVLSNPDTRIHINSIYFVKQFIISRLTKALVQNGLEDLIRSHFKSETMRNYTKPFASCIFGIGKLFNILWIFSCSIWLKKTVKNSRLDKYYLVLSCISFVNIFLYYLLVKKFGRVEDIQTEEMRSRVHTRIAPADNADSISNTKIQETHIICEPKTIDAPADNADSISNTEIQETHIVFEPETIDAPAVNADSISNTEIQKTHIIFKPETIDADNILVTDTHDEVRPRTDFDEARPNTDEASI